MLIGIILKISGRDLAIGYWSLDKFIVIKLDLNANLTRMGSVLILIPSHMELFGSSAEKDLGLEGANTLRDLILGSHGDVTNVLDMEPPIDSGLHKSSPFSEKLTDATDQGNVMNDRFSEW